MKVGIIADPIDNQKAGIHVYTREMVRVLVSQKGESDHLLLVREKKSPQMEGAEEIALPNIRWGLGLAALRLLMAVPLIFRWKKADIVIEPAHFGPFFLSKRQKRVTIIHDLTPIVLPEFHHWHSQWLQNKFLKGILRRADLVVANSEYTARDILKHYPFCENKMAWIYPGIDSSFKPSHEIYRLKRWNLHIENYWVFAGTIEPRKNLNRLLEAYELYRQKQPTKEEKLVIVGQKGWKNESFFIALESSSFKKDIILTGYVPKADLIALYTFAKGTIYPSLYEGFGFPVLEAFACGSLVVCSNTSSLPEVGAELAFYADPLSPEDICHQMERIDKLEKGDRTILQTQLQDWAARFTWERFGQEWWEELRKI